ncbi:sigma-70 family RNA polymerase sigma factor [Myxococcus landrumensis]|uniref:Sigma-70 family RNA polymerase sigma factor n=1 Tax=Myxococcus landrumensis TaxID=2813577 RepID=A0ABX7NHV1_9BACT|nr:sigma-70 family RNA polymerase sigma factor [Myxococcus landrumus]QSQ18335.1 sigma-70 family RNA polymerase sigma factor [Myxococcus landrumus]
MDRNACHRNGERKERKLSGYVSASRRQAELVTLVMRARASGDAALERRLSEEMLKSVRPIIRRVIGSLLARAGSLEPRDLEQVAREAVLRALTKYDDTRGSQSFGEVAFFRIRSACEQHTRMHSSDVHLSDGDYKRRTLRTRAREERSVVRVQSLDSPSQFSDDSSVAESRSGELEASLREMSGVDAGDESPEALLLAAERRALVLGAMRRLSSENQELVSLVFGFDGAPQSVRSLAEAWGTPKSRVNRMLASALEELRELLADEGA